MIGTLITIYMVPINKRECWENIVRLLIMCIFKKLFTNSVIENQLSVISELFKCNLKE